MILAEVLRAAADRIENAAAEATPHICPEWTYNAVRHIARNCEIECYHPDADADPNLSHDGWSRYGDSPWISLMGPQVASHLASWLRGHAEYTAAAQCAPDGHAVAFARVVLGETGEQP